MKKEIKGALLLYRCPLLQSAPTILEHVNSFEKYSKYKFWSLNVLMGFPKRLYEANFRIVILHYSLFGSYPFGLDQEFMAYLKSLRGGIKICFFQDEMQNCNHRVKLIDELEIDEIYSLIEPESYETVYLSHSKVRTIHHTLTGYVDSSFVELARDIVKEDKDRSIDIGYRGRSLPYHMGIGGQEKTMIAHVFKKKAKNLLLRMDIEVDESSRIYGEAWYHFIADCKAMIGVESGVSIFDIDNKVKDLCQVYLQKHPNATFEDVYSTILAPWENNIYYRTISPRVFECAALRVCMIQFEGRYNDILKPMEHYIPLNKDFSNFEWVISKFNDSAERKRITDNAYRDLIASGKYSYKKFVADFDQNLEEKGVNSYITDEDIKWVNKFIISHSFYRIINVRLKFLAYKLADMLIARIRRFNGWKKT